MKVENEYTELKRDSSICSAIISKDKNEEFMDINQIAEGIHAQKTERTSNWKNNANIADVKLPQLNEKPQTNSAMRKLNNLVKSLPIFRSLVKIRRIVKNATVKGANIDSLHREFLDLNHRFILSQQTIKSTHDNYLLLKEQNRILQQKVEALSLANTANKTNGAQKSEPPPEQINQNFDQLYRAFEDRFRGSEDNIRLKQSKYLQIFLDLPEDIRGKPIADIGCGRGEWLDIVKQNHLIGIGIEPNESMAKEAVEKDIDIEHLDAISYFKKAQSNSLGGVTSFHVVEHLELDYLFEMLQQACRVVASGGCIILETPNPENVIVGSCNFYTDPTHRSPIPPEALRFYVEQAGFIKTDILRLSPLKTDIDIPHSVLNEMAQRFFGPQDYAVIGYKP